MALSAYDPSDVAALRENIQAFFDASMVEGDLLIPYDRQSFLSKVYDQTRVLAEEHDEVGTRLRVRGLPAIIARLQRVAGGAT